MAHVYQRVANAVISLEAKINFQQIVMPIGLDGAVAYHLLYYRWERMGLKPEDNLSNTLQATSRFNEIDEAKLGRIIQHSYSKGKVLYGLDIRTKTGTLGAMLRTSVNLDVNFLYVVLFDPVLHADIRGSTEELTDADREHIYWVDSFEAERKLIRKEGEIWVYDLDHSSLSRLNHVQAIKELL